MIDDGRDAHLAWCKTRSLALVDDGRLEEAVKAMLFNMSMDDSTAPSVFGAFGFTLRMDGLVAVAIGPDAVRQWIEGFL